MLWIVVFEFILASKQLSKTVLLENLNVNFFESFALYFSQKMILISSQMLQNYWNYKSVWKLFKENGFEVTWRSKTIAISILK